MNKTKKLTFTLVLLILLLAFVLSINKKEVNYNNFQIRGEVGCSKDCFASFRVKNVFSGMNLEAGEEIDYGGIVAPQICEDMIEAERCTELDITQLSDYKTVVRTIGKEEKTFPKFAYINKYLESKDNKKIYFLYRVLRDELDVDKWVYDDPLAVISFNIETKEIKNEGQLGVTGLKVSNAYISPRGSYILIVDGSNPRYLPNTTTSGITVFDLKNKTTKKIDLTGNGGTFYFITWIDDTHFFYGENNYDSKGSTTIKIGTIK